MGLLNAAVPDDAEQDAEQAEAAGETITVDFAGDGASEAPQAAVVVATEEPAEEPPGEVPHTEEIAPVVENEDEEERPERVLGGELPSLRLNRVWSVLPTYTKKQLEGVYQKFGVGLWSQFEKTAGGPRFYSSMRKAEMLAFVQRVVRHHACLDAAERLSECQLDALHDWMRFNLPEQYHRDEDLRIAARLFGDFQAAAALSRDGHGLSPEAWNQYRKADLRRIAAFCYHRFYEAETAAVRRSYAA